MKKPYNHGASTIWDAINISKDTLPEVYTKSLVSLREESMSKAVEIFEQFLLDEEKKEFNLEKFRATIFIFLDMLESFTDIKTSLKVLVGYGMEEISLANRVSEFQQEKEDMKECMDKDTEVTKN